MDPDPGQAEPSLARCRNCSRITSGPPIRRRSTYSSITAVNSGGRSLVSSACRSSRVVTCCSTSSVACSPPPVRTPGRTAQSATGRARTAARTTAARSPPARCRPVAEPGHHRFLAEPALDAGEQAAGAEDRVAAAGEVAARPALGGLHLGHQRGRIADRLGERGLGQAAPARAIRSSSAKWSSMGDWSTDSLRTFSYRLGRPPHAPVVGAREPPTVVGRSADCHAAEPLTGRTAGGTRPGRRRTTRCAGAPVPRRRRPSSATRVHGAAATRACRRPATARTSPRARPGAAGSAAPPGRARRPGSRCSASIARTGSPC